MSSTLISSLVPTSGAFAKLRHATTKAARTCPTPWPEPEESIGTFEAKLGSLSCWKAVGPAREAWEQIYPKVKSHLETYTEPLATTSVIWIYRMIGSTPKASAPTIVFCCDEKVHRKAAKRAIANSEVLMGYNGIQLADLPRVPGSTGTLVVMSGNSPPAEDWMVEDWTSNDGPPTEHSMSTYYWPPTEDSMSDHFSMSSLPDSTGTLIDLEDFDYIELGSYRPGIEGGTFEVESQAPATPYSQSHSPDNASSAMTREHPNQMLVPVRDEYKATVFNEGNALEPGQSLSVQSVIQRGTTSTTTIGGSVRINGICCLMTAAHPFAGTPSPHPATEERCLNLSFSDSDGDSDQGGGMREGHCICHSQREPEPSIGGWEGIGFWNEQQIPSFHFLRPPLILNSVAETKSIAKDHLPAQDVRQLDHHARNESDLSLQDSIQNIPAYHFLRSPLILNQPTPSKLPSSIRYLKQDDWQRSHNPRGVSNGPLLDGVDQVLGYYFVQSPLVLNQPTQGELRALKAPSEQEARHFGHHARAIGRLLFSSIVDSRPELDYALILPCAECVNFDERAFISEESIDPFEFPEYTDKAQLRHLDSLAITAVVASAGFLHGIIDPTTAFIRPPNTRHYQEVYSVKFESPLAMGDCGSWVANAASQALHGHVIAGSPQDGLAYIVPAYQVFEDLNHFFTRDRLRQYFSRGQTGVSGIGAQFPVD
ncbi:hypothetical protein DE146DRAFT_218844 [Phaeosphaeria sp. MPI-PUGE-AT-0046c]|nr:hypothetical protein DE146DRAFT_218844 [Phaeosphaeria sp. MPI-PUGE-AT-0046c]